MSRLLKFFRDESGATAIKYGLIAALVAVVCYGVLVGVPPYVMDYLNNMFSSISKRV